MPFLITAREASKALPPPDDPPFKPLNKIRGCPYESVVMEMLYKGEKIQTIQDRLWNEFEFKVSWNTLQSYNQIYYLPVLADGIGEAAAGIKKAEQALQIDEDLKQKAFTDLLPRIDQLKSDIRILDELIAQINSAKNQKALLANSHQQMTLQRLIAARDDLRDKLNTELNNPKSFEAMKLEIMSQVAVKAISIYSPFISENMRKELLEKFKAEIKYL